MPSWWEGQSFDAILLDAPCSGSGVVRRHPDIRWLRRATDIAQLARQQARLLVVLWPLLKPGGRLLYCTCSVFKAEGQDQIKAFLGSNSNSTLLPSPGHLLPDQVVQWPGVVTIHCVTMMAFITHCLKNLLPRLLLGWLATAVLGLSVVLAQTLTADAPSPVLRLERADDALWLSTQLEFELSQAVIDALHKGIPIYFVAEADVLRERWYWTNKKVATARRHFRLAYHPLTRRGGSTSSRARSSNPLWAWR